MLIPLEAQYERAAAETAATASSAAVEALSRVAARVVRDVSPLILSDSDSVAASLSLRSSLSCYFEAQPHLRKPLPLLRSLMLRHDVEDVDEVHVADEDERCRR